MNDYGLAFPFDPREGLIDPEWEIKAKIEQE
jgi:hypothetical protein